MEWRKMARGVRGGRRVSAGCDFSRTVCLPYAAAWVRVGVVRAKKKIKSCLRFGHLDVLAFGFGGQRGSSGRVGSGAKDNRRYKDVALC